MNNGNGAKRWPIDAAWARTLVTVTSIIVAGTLAWANVRRDVEDGCKKNAEQDAHIQTNRTDINRHETELGRVDERYQAITATLQRIERKIDAN
jgi:septal ring factor EnvC (AmiA/AmiB activator)